MTAEQDELMLLSFGKHVKRLREVRRLTQEQLAERSGLAADTIRRLEHTEFSPSLRTLHKLSRGLNISVPVLFAGFTMTEDNPVFDDLVRLLHGRDEKVLVMVLRLAQVVLEHVEQRDGSASYGEAGT